MVVAESVLLPTDFVELYAPGELDGHGWRDKSADVVWSGYGNLQLLASSSDPRAASGGGRGAYDPNYADAGDLYLPAEAPAANGQTAVIRGRLFALANVRTIIDPTIPPGGIGCTAAHVSATDVWEETP
jgi:hypothetical protein